MISLDGMRKPAPTRRPDLSRERRLFRRGFYRIAGLDEAGRGAWAGPLAAAAVVLPVDLPSLRKTLWNVRDSKQMRPNERSEAADIIRCVALAWAVGSASATEVDALGPVCATRLAMLRALAGLPECPDHLLLDYLRLVESPLPQLAVTHGDALSLSIAAASVLAKTWRDAEMTFLGGRYPGYGFSRHKGYGTPEHARAVWKMGICPEHRLSYRPVKAACR
jgi:ribonuclease HII